MGWRGWEWCCKARRDRTRVATYFCKRIGTQFVYIQGEERVCFFLETIKTNSPWPDVEEDILARMGLCRVGIYRHRINWPLQQPLSYMVELRSSGDPALLPWSPGDDPDNTSWETSSGSPQDSESTFIDNDSYGSSYDF